MRLIWLGRYTTIRCVLCTVHTRYTRYNYTQSCPWPISYMLMPTEHQTSPRTTSENPNSVTARFSAGALRDSSAVNTCQREMLHLTSAACSHVTGKLSTLRKLSTYGATVKTTFLSAFERKLPQRNYKIIKGTESIPEITISDCVQRILREKIDTSFKSESSIQSIYQSPTGNFLGDVTEYLNDLFGGILFVKRTYQPSILRRKRKHGFLARQSTRHGRKIMNNRRVKKRTNLCG